MELDVQTGLPEEKDRTGSRLRAGTSLPEPPHSCMATLTVRYLIQLPFVQKRKVLLEGRRMNMLFSYLFITSELIIFRYGIFMFIHDFVYSLTKLSGR